MANKLQTKNFGQLLISLLLIICGIYVLFHPMTALLASALMVGIAFIILGIGYLYLYTQVKTYWALGLGILDLFIGIVFLSNMGVSAASMPIIFALWILFVGISQLTVGMDLKKVTDGAGGWKWWTASGVFGILFALLVFLFPAVGVLSITVIFGIYLIEYGAFELHRYLRGY